MNKKILSSVLAIGSVSAIVAGGGTWASWSDFTSTGTNSAGAGKLQVTLGGGDQAPLFSDLKMAPGGYGEKVVEVVSNDSASTPNGNLAVSLTNLSDKEDGCTTASEKLAQNGACDAPGAAGDFSKQAVVTVQAWRLAAQQALPLVSKSTCLSASQIAALAVPSGDPITGLTTVVAQASTLDALAGRALPTAIDLPKFGSTLAGIVTPGEKICVSTKVSLPATADNKTQGDSASFGVRFDLTQAAGQVNSNDPLQLH